MRSVNFETWPTRNLLNQKRFSIAAVAIVWTGAAFAFGAAMFQLLNVGNLPTTTLLVAIIAVVASIPVYLDAKRIARVLRNRA